MAAASCRSMPISFSSVAMYGNSVAVSKRARRPVASALAMEEASKAAADPQLTWQVVVGALAGVSPFVIAGIEFSKRIAAQRRCKVCGGSGLVKREQYYFRCNRCGGFLPWQSWKRFFSG